MTKFYYEELEHKLPAFTRPRLNQPGLTPIQLMAFHFKKNANFPIAVLADISGDNRENEFILWQDAGKAIFKQADKFGQLWLRNQDIGSNETRPVVGILASGDPLSYFVTFLALMKVDCIPFAISPRNSAPAIAHLLQTTNCRHLLVQFDPEISPVSEETISRQQVKSVMKILPKHCRISLWKMPTAYDLFPCLANEDLWDDEGDLEVNGKEIFEFVDANVLPSRTLWILHSSGTTKFPKPIYINQAAFQGALNIHYLNNFLWTGKITSMMALPPFHSMAYNVGFYPILAEGTISGLFRPNLSANGLCQSPNINPVTIMASMRKLDCNIGIFSPLTITEFSDDPEALEFLKKMERVGFGGGPLEPEVGNFLVSQGVKLAPVYGMTETGCMTKFFSENFQPQFWEYFEFSPHITYDLIAHGKGEYELVVKSSGSHRCALDFEETELRPQAFHTRDLLLKHPKRPIYRIIGRIDDQIMLSTSEKTNPVPLEAALSSDKRIKRTVMFGRGKPQNGVIVEPAPGFEVDVSDCRAVQQYIDSIWPSVERVNNFAPSHSRIPRNLILPIDPRITSLPTTPKGLVARAAALERFKREIKNLYSQSETALALGSLHSQFNFENIGEIPVERVRAIIKSIVYEVSGRIINDNENFFEHGCDSMHAAQIRSKIVAFSRATLKNSIRIPQNIIYQLPTINRLCSWVELALSPSKTTQASSIDDLSPGCTTESCRLWTWIDKYKPKPQIAVLITGTTGSLGAHVLEDILKSRNIDRVFALNRFSLQNQSATERHRKAFIERGLDCQLLTEPKLTFLTGNSLDDLSSEEHLELENTVTHIIHLSYPVNFNLNLDGFENSFKFTSQLTNLLRKSPRSKSVKPTFVFASSVSTLSNYDGNKQEWVDEAEVDLMSCLGSGYGESKRVCEEIVQASAEEYDFISIILRIGQLCGSRGNGSWNHNEWFPLMVQSFFHLGCLPDGFDDVAWIPVDEAARALNDIAFYQRSDAHKKPYELIYRHLIHPKPTTWHSIIERIRQVLSNEKHSSGGLGKQQIELVSYKEWLQRLVNAKEEGAYKEVFGVIGALKLIEYFENQLTQGGLHETPRKGFEAMGVKRMITRLSETESAHLRDCHPIGENDVDKWLNYWRKTGLFQMPNTLVESVS
ncbi:hypothetical protein O181_013138 [Austropuccinia psidii MF-1]|uniref:Carrier domain-containing protein n=1 Tax=Austropuccinia psidii MF-1 TaxID=1389203 RepID=A0A9Q3GMU2_9BASI|nr:hypothetical protein [Austropuccinia psidii MF-1]